MSDCVGGRARRRRVGVVVVGLCLIAGCDDASDGTSATSSTAPSTEPTSEPTSAPTTGPPEGFDLDAIVTAALGDRDGGVTALVVRDGDVLTAAAGVTNSDGDPMAAATPLRVGSITKPFVATMVLQLVDEGRVNLDERLATYLPETPVGDDVTIRDLLRHYSGLPNYTDMNAFFPDVLADRSRRFEPAELLTYVETERPGPPGRRFAYSNTNYILLGQLIERVDGVDLNTALRTRITGPLDLPTTQFALTGGSGVSGLAAGWSPDVVDGEPVTPYDSIESSAWAAGALVSTTAELAAFLTALSAGDLMSDDSLTAMTDMGSVGYGLGLQARRFGTDGRGYGHSGGMPGYLSFMAIEPTTGDTIVVLTNNDTVNVEEMLRRIILDW